jgi:CheY-like chemotaxis protein
VQLLHAGSVVAAKFFSGKWWPAPCCSRARNTPKLPTVLVVEDDVPLRNALVAALAAGGYRAKEAGDVPGALEQMTSDHVDVVLSDIGMPGNGYSLLARVRELRPSVPVILMTGIEEDDHGRRARAAGAYAYLIKPIQLSVLKQTLDEACRHA